MVQLIVSVDSTGDMTCVDLLLTGGSVGSPVLTRKTSTTGFKVTDGIDALMISDLSGGYEGMRHTSYGSSSLSSIRQAVQPLGQYSFFASFLATSCSLC
jgi:hypothetical protein